MPNRFQGSIAGLPVWMTYNGVTSRFRETLRIFEDASPKKPAIHIDYEFCDSPLPFPEPSTGINNMRFQRDPNTGQYRMWEDGQPLLLTAQPGWEQVKILSRLPVLPERIEKNLSMLAFQSRFCLSDGLFMHGAIAELQDRAVVFTGSSGAGKSTQATLWRKHLGARILNGDKAFLLCKRGETRAFGSPWSGSSPDFSNASAPLQAVVVLRQAGENQIRKLSIPESLSLFATHCYYPYWDAALVEKTMDSLDRLLTHTPVYLLCCRPDKLSVETAYRGIFTY